MSVIRANQSNSSMIHNQLLATRQSITTILTHYRIDLQQYSDNIQTTLQQLTQSNIAKIKQQQQMIQQLQNELNQVKDSKLILQQRVICKQRQCQQLMRNNNELKAQHSFKQQKIQELNEQIQQIRHYIVQMQQQNQKQVQANIVNFDDNSNHDISHRFNDLQTINQVSQYDMSVSASMESLSSCFNQAIEGKNSCFSGQVQTNTTIEQKPVQSYQDALQFLKNYNSSNNGNKTSSKQQDSGQYQSVSMPRKNKLTITSAKQNIPIANESTQSKPHKNQTIAKIKKMRKIQSLQLQSGYIVKSDKKQNKANMNTQDIVLVERDNNQKNSKQSLPSRKSYNINQQQIVSLHQPIQQLNSLIQQLNHNINHQLKIHNIPPSLCKISYQNNIFYHGSCDHNYVPNGYGKLLKGSQTIYQGEWRNGRFHGWGKLVLISLFNQPHSKSIIQVDGNFRNGCLQGTCVCVFTSGQKFMGSIQRGNIEHEGTYVSEKGILTGHWESSTLVLLI